MTDNEWLAERFEEHRPHLRTVAYRMLGASGEVAHANSRYVELANHPRSP